MASTLAISLGQHSAAGRKPVNQDFYGAIVPEGPALQMKGVALAIADGISSSPVSHLAAQTAVRSFLEDYYCTSDGWTVATSAGRVVAAANAWLYGQGRAARLADPEGGAERGFVTTFSALVLHGRMAHLFHVGDSRIQRLEGGRLDCLTQDHHTEGPAGPALSRALGMARDVRIDHAAFPVAEGDVFLLTTDGVHDHLPASAIALAIEEAGDLDAAARAIVSAALKAGSADNLTIQILRVDALPEPAEALREDAADDPEAALLLPLPRAVPEPGEIFEGWHILGVLHASARSHVFEAEDTETGERAALKVAARDKAEDQAHLRAMAMEEWVARRLAHPHLLKAVAAPRPRRLAHTTMALVEGITLDDWMRDNRNPDLADIRPIVAQIASGLQEMHRRGMVHCDLKPANVMIDETGHVTVIDFGSTRIAGVEGAAPVSSRADIPGALQYTAPEILLGDPITPKADVFALGTLAYQLLTGRLPYGAAMARTRTRREQRRIAYDSASGEDSPVPLWADAALKRAVHPDPDRRYDEVAELVADLATPNRALGWDRRPSFAERDPVRFWQAISAVLAVLVLVLLASGASNG
ncbi:bifunctional protein-serine/threonine kinase/phosphatase [Fulvimarina endophytica]|uniref:Bifunctional protein-serine/threonine kinase/phosphatase n=1 Tax=Fulvimarina endophytica TaxID=2293836 RepID=A0A371WYB1_9HYPH|nr:bifunctional protein-serine/threonine kinase/phosphatase [Fulvimarina endophytica]RFC61958.1 bifunctional protein-serine/threonine kinase/phosphatase [Fulvimarina endophytica]